MRTMGITEEDKQRFLELAKENIYLKAAPVYPDLNKFRITITADLYNQGNIDDVKRGLHIEIDGTEENITIDISEVIE